MDYTWLDFIHETESYVYNCFLLIGPNVVVNYLFCRFIGIRNRGHRYYVDIELCGLANAIVCKGNLRFAFYLTKISHNMVCFMGVIVPANVAKIFPLQNVYFFMVLHYECNNLVDLKHLLTKITVCEFSLTKDIWICNEGPGFSIYPLFL